MNKIIFFAVTLSLIKCHSSKIDKTCIQCQNQKCAEEIADKFAQKKAKNYKDLVRRTKEETGLYIIYYHNSKNSQNPLAKGGGSMLIHVAKANCKVIDFKILK